MAYRIIYGTYYKADLEIYPRCTILAFCHRRVLKSWSLVILPTLGGHVHGTLCYPAHWKGSCNQKGAWSSDSHFQKSIQIILVYLNSQMSHSNKSEHYFRLFPWTGTVRYLEAKLSQLVWSVEEFLQYSRLFLFRTLFLYWKRPQVYNYASSNRNAHIQIAILNLFMAFLEKCAVFS